MIFVISIFIELASSLAAQLDFQFFQGNNCSYAALLRAYLWCAVCSSERLEREYNQH